VRVVKPPAAKQTQLGEIDETRSCDEHIWSCLLYVDYDTPLARGAALKAIRAAKVDVQGANANRNFGHT